MGFFAVLSTAVLLTGHPSNQALALPPTMGPPPCLTRRDCGSARLIVEAATRAGVRHLVVSTAADGVGNHDISSAAAELSGGRPAEPLLCRSKQRVERARRPSPGAASSAPAYVRQKRERPAPPHASPFAKLACGVKTVLVRAS